MEKQAACSRCGKSEGVSFGTRKGPPRKDGSQATLRRSWCKACEAVKEKGRRRTDRQLRDKVRLSRYQRSFWTQDKFEEAWTEQAGCCKICGVVMTELRREGVTAVHADHHPLKNIPRALLCRGCNAGLGMFRDRADLLRAAAEYLDSY